MNKVYRLTLTVALLAFLGACGGEPATQYGITESAEVIMKLPMTTSSDEAKA